MDPNMNANMAYQPHALDAVSAGLDQVFVIGTGRCGSTLTSAMLRQHPRILSLSEWFSFITDLGCAIDAVFPPGLVSGGQMWAILAARLPRQNLMLRHDIAMPEVLYPWQHHPQPGPGMTQPDHEAAGHVQVSHVLPGHEQPRAAPRFSAQSGVPAIAQVSLPHISEEPDALFDALQAVVCALPAAPVGVQYQRVFAWLAQRQQATVWVERSGGGLRIVARLMQHFPRARFVHIVRDGADTALSMSVHRGFRFVFAAFQLLEVLGVDPYVSDDRRWEGDLNDEQASLLPEHFTRQAFLAFSTPPPMCGHYWSGEICHGMSLLQDLPPGKLLTIRYEDLLQHAAQTATAMLRFIRRGEFDVVADGAWEQQVAAMIRQPTSSWQTISARVREQTVHACRPGVMALARAGVIYP